MIQLTIEEIKTRLVASHAKFKLGEKVYTKEHNNKYGRSTFEITLFIVEGIIVEIDSSNKLSFKYNVKDHYSTKTYAFSERTLFSELQIQRALKVNENAS